MEIITGILESLRFEPLYIESVRLGIGLLSGGLLAIYLKFLYEKCTNSILSSDSFARVFPLLTMITTCVIAVVKSSLALSLGLVGALSIVRFRAAIKDPEELVWLFLCIAIGLAIGAGHIIYAAMLVFIVSFFVLWKHYFISKTANKNSLIVTITGDAVRYFKDPESGVFGVLEKIANVHSIQRYEIDNEVGTVRVIINKSNIKQTVKLFSKLKELLPDCNISYINMSNTI